MEPKTMQQPPRHPRARGHRRGFLTLAELMLTAMLIAIIVVILGGVTHIANTGIGIINSHSVLDMQLTNATDFILRDATFATDALDTCCPGNTGLYTADPTSTLILRLAAVNAQGQRLSSTAYDYLIYTLDTSDPDNPILMRIVDASPGSARESATFAWAPRRISPRAPGVWLMAASRRFSDWIIPRAEAAGGEGGDPPPPPPPPSRQAWGTVIEFRYALDDDLPAVTTFPGTYTQYVHVELTGSWNSPSGHPYQVIRRFKAVFKGI